MSSVPELVSFDRAQIERLLSLLDGRLKDREVAASVYLVGGAAIAMSVNDSRRTLDVDAVVSHAAVLEEAEAIADKEGLPRTWLNQRAAPWIPPGARRAMAGPKKPGLSRHIAPKEHLLAMKLVAMRRQDVPDIVALAIDLEMADATADDFADLLVTVYDGEDALQQVLNVPYDDVATEALRLGEAAERVMKGAPGTRSSP